jgi:hypothetical protein
MTVWFEGFFSAVLAVGTLGAGFTFSVIFSDLENLDKTVNTKAVRRFLIIAWLLFVMAVALASVGAALMRFAIPEIIESFNCYGDWVNFAAAAYSIVLQLLLAAAFLMSALAMWRYDNPSGKAALICISAGSGLVMLGWIVRAV